MNIVVAGPPTTTPLTVEDTPHGVGIMPPPPGHPFLDYNARLRIALGAFSRRADFKLRSQFTLSSTASNGINPATEAVTLQVGTFTATIPPGSFKKHEHEGDEDEGEDGSFTFHGVIDGVRLKALIKPMGTLRYAFLAKAKGADLTGTTNPVPVTLIIGGGTTSVTAAISP